MTDDENKPKLRNNSKLVAAACNHFFARKGICNYDIKGNQVHPLTKQLTTLKKCKHSSKASRR